MNEFFRGWKRKIGLLTLVMALALMGMWSRGHKTEDLFQYWTKIGTEKITYQLVFSHYGIMWRRNEDAHIRKFFPTTTLIGWFHAPIDGSYFLPGDRSHIVQSEIACRWKCCGFDFCDLTSEQFSKHTRYWNIPYWSIVIPLTLLSAFLLLSKPKTSTQKKIVEPAAIEGV